MASANTEGLLMHRLAFCLPATLWLFCLLAPTVPASTGPIPGIVLLTSYHQGDPWNDHIVTGFLEAFSPDRASVYVEQLDSRRFPEQDYLEDFSALLARKYARTPIQVLASADDAALHFWLTRGQALFPGRPLVFCGINDLDPSLLANRTDVTGVLEAPDVLGTLEMALKLLPRVTTIVAVGSTKTAGDRGNLQRFRRAMRTLERRAHAMELLDVTPIQAQQALLALPRDAVVIRLGALEKATPDRILPRGRDITLLTEASPVPVLVLWDYDLGSGALGGRVVSGTAQGRGAAGLTAKILAGQSPSTLPVADAPNQLELDNTVLHRFGIPLRNVPQDAIVLHKPVSTYQRHKTLFWSAGVALAVLLPVTLILALVLAGRQTAENRLRESERRYRELVECANSLILRFDAAGHLVFVNEYAERLLGYGLADLPDGLEWLRPQGPADLTGLLAQAMVARQELKDSVVENEIETRDGRRLVLRWDNRQLRDDHGQPTGWLAVGTDITERRRAEEALAARMLAEEELLAFGRELLADGQDALPRALPHLLTAFGADRTGLFENVQDPSLGLCCRPVLDMRSPRLSVPDAPATEKHLPYSLDAYAWANALEAGDTVTGDAEDFPERLQEVLRARHIRSVLAAPVTRAGMWYGFLIIGQCRVPRRFTRQDRTQLAMAAGMLSAHLSRTPAGG